MAVVLFVGVKTSGSKIKRRASFLKRCLIIGCDCTEYPLKMCKFNEPLSGVLGNTGTGALTFREQGTFSNYLQGTGELLIRLLGSREHLSTLKCIFLCFE